MKEINTPIILVVEDEALLLQAISKKLEINGFQVVTATTGEQAIDCLASLTELPNAIWLDYYLKDMNGLDFMYEMTKNEDWKKIPVVVVSNSASNEKVHSMLALGARKYLLKAQYRLEEIIAIVKQFIMEEKNGQPK